MAAEKKTEQILATAVAEGKKISDGDWSKVAASLEDLAERAQTLAVLAAADDEELRRRWWGMRKPAEVAALEPAEVLLFVAVEDAGVEEAIDEALGGPEGARIVDAMARMEISWSSPHLVAMLDDPELRQAAAFTLLEGDREALEDWLDGCEEPFEALEVFRVAALSGEDALFELAEDWCEALEEAEETRAARYLRGAMAALDPRAFARKLVLGETDLDWLSNSTCVADFLQVHGPSDWVETLALLEEGGARAAFEFAALIAVASAFDDSRGDGDVDSDDDEAEEHLLALAEHAEDPYRAAQEFAFQIALGEEDDLIALLTEASLHERARRLQMPSAGLAGLLLSGTDVEALPKLEKVELFFNQMARKAEMTPEDLVVATRTLSDLGAWYIRMPDRFEELVGHGARRFKRHDQRPLSLAAQRLEALLEGKAGEVEKLVERARSEKMTGFDAVRSLIVGDKGFATQALAELWTLGPRTRSSLYRDALLAGLT